MFLRDGSADSVPPQDHQPQQQPQQQHLPHNGGPSNDAGLLLLPDATANLHFHPPAQLTAMQDRQQPLASGLELATFLQQPFEPSAASLGAPVMSPTISQPLAGGQLVSMGSHGWSVTTGASELQTRTSASDVTKDPNRKPEAAATEASQGGHDIPTFAGSDHAPMPLGQSAASKPTRRTAPGRKAKEAGGEPGSSATRSDGSKGTADGAQAASRPKRAIKPPNARGGPEDSHLSPEERRRIRRRIANRESARRVRKGRQELTDELQGKVDVLSVENSTLMQRVMAAESHSLTLAGKLQEMQCRLQAAEANNSRLTTKHNALRSLRVQQQQQQQGASAAAMFPNAWSASPAASSSLAAASPAAPGLPLAAWRSQSLPSTEMRTSMPHLAAVPPLHSFSSAGSLRELQFTPQDLVHPPAQQHASPSPLPQQHCGQPKLPMQQLFDPVHDAELPLFSIPEGWQPAAGSYPIASQVPNQGSAAAPKLQPPALDSILSAPMFQPGQPAAAAAASNGLAPASDALNYNYSMPGFPMGSAAAPQTAWPPTFAALPAALP